MAIIDIYKKFKFRGKAIVIHSPENLRDEFIEIGCPTMFDKNIKSANTLIFVNNKREFLDFLNRHIQKTEEDSVLWFAYPKGTSKVKTDVNRDVLWKTANEFNLDAVAAISIDNIWSALRFRPINKIGT